MHRKEIRCISTDPGIVNHGICHLAFYGFEYQQDEKNEWVKIPQFDILNLELWDLKRCITYAYNEEKNCITRNRYGSINKNQVNEDFMQQAENFTKMIGSKEWLFESYHSSFFNQGEQAVYPPIVTELQCGHVKEREKVNDNKWDVFLVSHILPWSVKSIHYRKGEEREVISRARKYGIPSNGDLTYAQRKAKSEEVARALLKLTGKQKWINFLNALKAARKLDVPGKTPQCHDCCDSLTLGLEYCIKKYEELEKGKEELHIAKPLEIVIEDDEDEHLLSKKKMISIAELSDTLTKAFEERDKSHRKRKRENTEESKSVKKPRKKSDKEPKAKRTYKPLKIISCK